MTLRVCIGPLVALAIALAAPPARAERVAVPDAHGESDVADEAYAVTLLVRGALSRDPGTLVAADTPIALAHATAACASLGADHLVLVDVARDGTGLRATMAIASATGALELAAAHAGDGDVVALATAVVDKVVAVTGVRAGAVPAVGLGALRPYAAAVRARGDPRAAAAALADALPGSAVSVPAAASALAPVIAAIEADHRVGVDARAIAARRANAAETLGAIARGSDDAAAGARALTALDRLDVGAAQAAVDKLPAKDALVGLAQAALAERSADDARLDTLLQAGLAGDQRRAFAAFAATVAPSRLSPAVHRTLLALADQADHAGESALATRIGAAAARAGVDRDHALALVSIRELAADEATALEPLLVGTSPTVLRLRAELAMRRSSADTAAAIAAFVAAAGAPAGTGAADEGRSRNKDLRAQRYLGWRLAAQAQWSEAADAFARAGATRELSRARLLAGDAKRAAADVHGAPSAEDLAAQARAALDAGRPGEAALLLDRAELAGPADPVVAREAVAIATARHDDAHAALARRLVELDEPAIAGGAGSATGSAGSAAAPAITGTTVAPAPTPTEGDPLADLAAPADPDLARAVAALLGQLPLGHVHRVVVGALPTRSSWLRGVSGERVAPALGAALRDARIAVASFDRAVDDAAAARADSMRGDADAVLLYRAGAGSRVDLMLYRIGAPAADVVSGDVPNLVAWDLGHCALLAGGLLAVALVVVLALRTRGVGQLDVTIERPPDASDEVYCVAVSHDTKRPNIGDVARFHTTTRAAGPIADKRVRTLVGRTSTFRLPAGRWHVHLYGAFERGGTLRAIPDTASKDVEVRRGRTATVAFDLVPTQAELHLQIRGGGKRVTVATTERDKVYADPEGRAMLPLAVGTHTLIIEYAGGTLRRGVHVPTARIQRLAIDVREDTPAVALGSAPEVPLPLPDGSPSLPRAVSVAFSRPGKQPSTQPGSEPVVAHAALAALDQAADALVDAAVARPRTLSPQQTRAAHNDALVGQLAAMIDVELDAPGALAPPAEPAHAPSVPGELVGPPALSAPALSDPARSRPGPTPRHGSPRPDTARPDSRPDVKLNVEVKLHERFLDRYEVTAELGRGAMGVVHRARDEKLERDVAIKEMADELRQYPEAMRLFRQEAKALAQLNHTNIVAMYDQVDDGDHVWMIMEYVDGRTLESILDERVHLPWMEAVSIVDQVCAGLAFAHARKIIHRDVKPGNIFVAHDHIVKLGDFGLASVAREVSNRRTEARGTPLYMAPEQVTGDAVDARTDLYAVGCTLFEMTTGRPPFIDGDIRYKQVHEFPPRPGTVGATIPAALEKLIMKLIAKEPGDRPESAMAVRMAFKDIL